VSHCARTAAAAGPRRARSRSPAARRPPQPLPPPTAAANLTRAPLSAVRFGDLPVVERKATNKVTNKSLLSAFDDTHVCTGEIAEMLECFTKADFNTAACKPEIAAMHACVDVHQYDESPKVLAHRWQTQMRGQIFRHFAQARLPPGLRR